MPDKHADTDRWGGPGASHENRNKARPDPLVKDADAPDHLSPRSQISGGGGEGDVHKGHSAKAKHEKRSTSQEKRHERDGRH
ncbi:hypothetical protein ACQKKG_00095 [Brevundimonas sp. NPDC003935]|jgi:hypothetical protein|uniref:hypothetical protein n=1 Tax=unclassified Brevundimonas TaxID=2622653 RepID=UPI0028A254C0|nr:hypothetical protein [Brevundimonas sp.]